MRAQIDNVDIQADGRFVDITIRDNFAEFVKVEPGIARLIAAAIIEAAKEAETYRKGFGSNGV